MIILPVDWFVMGDAGVVLQLVAGSGSFHPQGTSICGQRRFHFLRINVLRQLVLPHELA